MMKQILFIQKKTLFLLEYIVTKGNLTYKICDNVTLGVTGLWQGTCIVKGTDKDLEKLRGLYKNRQL